MGKPLVRFWEGQEINPDEDEIVWHRRESRRKQRKQTSSGSHGRLLSTRKMRAYSSFQDYLAGSLCRYCLSV